MKKSEKDENRRINLLLGNVIKGLENSKLEKAGIIYIVSILKHIHLNDFLTLDILFSILDFLEELEGG